MLGDDEDLLPSEDLYKFPTIGQISKMSPIGPLLGEGKAKMRKKRRGDDATQSQELTKTDMNFSMPKLGSQHAVFNHFKNDMIAEEPRSSGQEAQEAQQMSPSPLGGGKFESGRDEDSASRRKASPTLATGLPAQPAQESQEQEIRPVSSTMQSQDFSDGLPKPLSRSFADAAKEAKDKEDFDFLNMLMVNDGKVADDGVSNVVASNGKQGSDGAPEPQPERKSRQGEYLQETSKFAAGGLHSPVYDDAEHDRSFKLGVGKDASKDTSSQMAADGKQKQTYDFGIEELTQKSRQARSRLQDRRSKSRPGSQSSRDQNSGNDDADSLKQYAEVQTKSKQESEKHQKEEIDDPVAQVSINDISFSEEQ